MERARSVMRRRLDFYDFLFGSVGLLFLTLTVPLLPHWIELPWQRKVVISLLFLIGAVACWMLLNRPGFLKDNPSERADVFDFIIAGAGCLFAFATWGQAIRCAHGAASSHRLIIVSVLGFLLLFSAYCLVQRGGLKSLRDFCFILSGLSFLEWVWQLSGGPASPKSPWIHVSREVSYIPLLLGLILFIIGFVVNSIHRRSHKC